MSPWLARKHSFYHSHCPILHVQRILNKFRFHVKQLAFLFFGSWTLRENRKDVKGRAGGEVTASRVERSMGGGRAEQGRSRAGWLQGNGTSGEAMASLYCDGAVPNKAYPKSKKLSA